MKKPKNLAARKFRSILPVFGGDGFEGYVVIENNTNDLAPSDWGRFTVRVARI